MGFATPGNGTISYTCCYLPDLPNATVWGAKNNPTWPGGYTYTNAADCTPSAGKTGCEDYDQTDFDKVQVLKEPCASAFTKSMSGLIFALVLASLLIN